MDAQKQKTLIDGGVNYEEALASFMDNEKMLTKYLGRFLSEKSYAALEDAMAKGDHAAASMAAHTLKSVCGTLHCDAMHKLVVDQEAAIKANDWATAEKLMPQIQAEYHRVCDAIKACSL